MVWLTWHVYLWVSCCPTDVSLRGHRSLSEELEKQHEEVKFDSKTSTCSGVECHMTCHPGVMWNMSCDHIKLCKVVHMCKVVMSCD